MSSNKPTKIDDVSLIVQIVQVTRRLGLSMAGAMCGTFVAAQLTMTNAELFDSAGFIALMVLVGILGLYLVFSLRLELEEGEHGRNGRPEHQHEAVFLPPCLRLGHRVIGTDPQHGRRSKTFPMFRIRAEKR